MDSEYTSALAIDVSRPEVDSEAYNGAADCHLGGMYVVCTGVCWGAEQGSDADDSLLAAPVYLHIVFRCGE